MRTVQLIFTVGIPGSGKSTWAREQQENNDRVAVVERDAIRAAIQGESDNRPDWTRWKWKREKEVSAQHRSEIEAFVKYQHAIETIIVADTNLDPVRTINYGREIQNWARDEGIEVSVDYKVFCVDREVALKRDAARAKGVGVQVIDSMLERFHNSLSVWADVMDEEDREKYAMDIAIKKFADGQRHRDSLPRAIIVDIDGTIADMTGVRGPFDWANVGLDAPREDIIEMAQAVARVHNARIIVMSGRDGVCEQESREWMARHGMSYDDFYIRPAGDMRKDTIIKKELYFNNVHGQYNVVQVIDDRPAVCRMWRSLGLSVIQVADPHKEF